MSAHWPAVSHDDPRLVRLADLPRQGGRRTTDIVLEGEATVRRAIAAGHAIDLVVATPACASRFVDAAEIERGFVLTEPELSRLVGYPFHRGCLALAPRPAGTAWVEAIERIAAQPTARIVALDRIADPENVGAVIRTARALAVDLVLVGRGSADPWSRRAIRSSMGHSLAQPLAIDVDLVAALAVAPERLQWWATDSDGDPSVLAASERGGAPARLGLVFGNEGDGVVPAVTSLCAHRISIPTASAAESLNVAAAAAIVLWALGRPSAS